LEIDVMVEKKEIEEDVMKYGKMDMVENFVK
jgi:hypothetical protein